MTQQRLEELNREIRRINLMLNSTYDQRQALKEERETLQEAMEKTNKIGGIRMIVPVYVYFDKLRENQPPTGLYTPLAIDPSSVTILHPKTNQPYKLSHKQTTLVYNKDDVDEVLDKYVKPLEVSHIFVKWYDILKKETNLHYDGKESLETATRYQALRYISAFDPSYGRLIDNITHFDDENEINYHLSKAELESLSKEISENKDGFLQAVLSNNFVKKERWTIAIKEAAAKIMMIPLNDRFLHIQTESARSIKNPIIGKMEKIPAFTKKAKASVLTKEETDTWLTYFKEHEIPVEAIKL